MTPLVSVVIPTRGRPDMVCSAVRSALNQGYHNMEVIVVVDGPDSATTAALEALEEPRLRVLALGQNVGGSEARNLGVREANGDWIALLDDDDTWLPEKIREQMAVASLSAAPNPIVTSRVIVQRDHRVEIWPVRRLKPNESVGEYLFCRTRIATGEGCIQTSTLLIKRDLLLKQPFTKGLVRHQDWDWLLRVSEDPSVAIEWVWEPLAVYNLTGGRNNISASSNWRVSHSWAKQMKQITPIAFLYFVAGQIAPRVNLFRDFWAIPGLLREMLPREGFSLNALRIFLVLLLIPTSYRRAWVSRPKVSKMQDLQEVEGLKRAAV
jgi:glycosyltransferase involved in cell wall biosynthesis